MPRFTIVQHHWQGVHWDLFLENNDTLITWELSSEPDASPSILARTKPDHRLKYLNYEGEISENRGYITQWDSGEFFWQARHDYCLSFLLEGTKLRGEATLTKKDDHWLFEFSAK